MVREVVPCDAPACDAPAPPPALLRDPSIFACTCFATNLCSSWSSAGPLCRMSEVSTGCGMGAPSSTRSSTSGSDTESYAPHRGAGSGTYVCAPTGESSADEVWLASGGTPPPSTASRFTLCFSSSSSSSSCSYLNLCRLDPIESSVRPMVRSLALGWPKLS